MALGYGQFEKALGKKYAKQLEKSNTAGSTQHSTEALLSNLDALSAFNRLNLQIRRSA